MTLSPSNSSISRRNAVALACAAALAMAACTSAPPAAPVAGKQTAMATEPAAELRRAAASDPVPNWFHLPERLLSVGNRALFETSDGPARYEVAMLSRSGDVNAIRVRWTALPASHAYLKDLVTTYVVDDRGAVRGARIEDVAAKAFQPAKVAQPGGPGYVSQPTVMRLPVAESAELGGRKLRIDAVAVVEMRERDGVATRVHYLSDDAKFGVVRIDAFPSRVVSVSDVVGQVAAARMQAGQPGAKPLPLSEALAARPGAAKVRVVTRLVEESEQSERSEQ